MIFDIFDRLDLERINYIHVVERYARKIPLDGIYEWSAIIEKSRRVMAYWKLRFDAIRADILPPE